MGVPPAYCHLQTLGEEKMGGAGSQIPGTQYILQHLVHGHKGFDVSRFSNGKFDGMFNQSWQIFVPSHQDSGGTNEIAARRIVLCPKNYYPMLRYHVTSYIVNH